MSNVKMYHELLTIFQKKKRHEVYLNDSILSRVPSEAWHVHLGSQQAWCVQTRAASLGFQWAIAIVGSGKEA